MTQINTYHCLCTSLLLSTTHKLSSLPTRQSSNNTSDQALILPIPSSPPSTTTSATGYTILLSLLPDSKTTIIRREDGFEKRVLYKCGRCGVVIGYEIVSSESSMDVEGEQVFGGNILYILPGGVMSTDVMSLGGVWNGGDGGMEQKIGEASLDIVGSKSVSVFE